MYTDQYVHVDFLQTEQAVLTEVIHQCTLDQFILVPFKKFGA